MFLIEGGQDIQIDYSDAAKKLAITKTQGGKYRKAMYRMLVLILLVLTGPSVMAQSTDNPVTYTVREGDCLVDIAVEYGNPNYWFQIYEANKDKIKRPDLIFPGQVFVIPKSILPQGKPAAQRSDSSSASKQEELAAFRAAFKKLQAANHAQKQKQQKNADISRKNVDSGIEFGGMVIDETQSKIGRDFYDVFYRYWDAPNNAPDFVITISEKPVPSMGTMVNIEINDTKVYQSRLQPRYDYITQVGKNAVSVCYRWLSQQMQTQTLLGY